MQSTLREVLEESDLFKVLSGESLISIGRLAHAATFIPGEVIFREGDAAEEVFLVSHGKVAIEIGLRLGGDVRRPATIHTVSSGESFGWTALVSPNVRFATARSLSETEVLFLMGSDLHELFQQKNWLGWQVMSQLVSVVSGRLWSVRETLAHILAIASHDLRAPLNAVNGFHQLLLLEYVGHINEEQRALLLKAEERITGLRALISNILDLSRVGRGDLKKETISLIEIAESCLEVVKWQAKEKGVKLASCWSEDLLPIDAQSARLQQTIINLLDNAVRNTPSNGSVTLRLEDTGDEVIVEVNDTGVGIPEDVLPGIFDDFYQGHDTEVGAVGLGLSIAKRIVEDHGGRIWAESPCPDSGVGTRVVFTLPRHGHR